MMFKFYLLSFYFENLDFVSSGSSMKRVLLFARILLRPNIIMSVDDLSRWSKTFVLFKIRVK